MVLTANVLEGTADHLGSNRGAGFLEDHEQLQKQFLSYCSGMVCLYVVYLSVCLSVCLSVRANERSLLVGC